MVPALHGGLLGDPTVLPMVAEFLSGRQVTDADDAQLRSDAELITSVATAWRMPVTTPPARMPTALPRRNHPPAPVRC